MSAVAATTALFRRDIQAVVRSRSQLYSSIFTPLLLLVFLGTGVSRGLEPSALSAGNFTAYLVAGAVVMTSVFSSTFASASFYRDRDTGILRMFLSSPHSPRVILLGKSLAGVAIGSLQALVVLLVAAPFVEFEWQYGLFAGLAISLAAIVLLNVMLAGIAQALASRIQTMQGFHLLMNLVLFPLLFFSGAFFPVDGLPAWLEMLARINPLSYGVDALLLSAYADGTAGYFGLAVDFIVLAALSVASYGLGLARMPRLTWSGR
ncbi:MAG TPA: ABC transporter permease [Tepidiformaceae bacterium]|nr:ABC transporter permease [Tepidiformaceae bacterium]